MNAYDALNRPTVRNADIFGYNDRSEVTSAAVFSIASSYGYDEIGNSTSFSPNNLNQYTEFTYDLDGNLLTEGAMSFTYDADNRLKTVSTNGVLALTNFYDAKSRRVKKVTPEATTIFFYDDWNLIEERIAYTNGTSSTIRYYWGKDISGTLQGAGGVGGLLYLTVDGAVYVPFYDNINPKELPKETFFIIDNELVAPFEIIWNLTYDGLIHFDENVAVQAYKRRVERDREVRCEK